MSMVAAQRRTGRGQVNAASSGWTDDRIAELKRLWADGLSCSEIARALGEGLSRNAVIGKVTRLRLPGRRTHTQTLGRAPKRPEHHQHRTVQRSRPRPPRPAAVPTVEDAKTAEPSPLGISLMELTAQTCKWPVGDPKRDGFGFCGHPPRAGKPYCEFHFRASCGQGTSWERSAVQDAKEAARS